MLLERIKKALESLYEDIQESPEETAEVKAETPAEAEAPAPTESPEAAAVETAGQEAQAGEEASAEEKAEGETAEPPSPPGPRVTDYQAKGYNLDVELPPEKIPQAAEILLEENFFLETITGVDWIDDQQLEAVYDFNHFEELCRVVLRTRTDRSNPEVPTISNIFQGANWHERETHDFFGINFTGHPYLEPLLLPEDADFHPLLKDFKA